MISLKQELRSNASSHLIESLDSRDSKNSLRQRQVRISEIVTNNDGTKSLLKHNSSPTQDHTGLKGQGEIDEENELKERIDAYSKALGPTSYRTVLDEDSIEEVQGTCINELGNAPPDLSYDGNYRSLGSYKPPSTESRRHSTPRKTPVTKS